VTVAGQRDTARGQLRFGFPPATRQLDDAGAIALYNTRYAAAILIAALAVVWTPGLRPILDTALIALLGFNAAAIGFALAAYGTRLIHAIALHATLELAAFALAGAAYLRARRHQLAPRQLLVATAASLALIAAGALVETWVAPGARP